MNPNASAFVFNPSATTWTPPVPPPPAVTKPALQPPVAAVVVAASEEEDEEAEEEMDENDPLWKATLVIAGGDRKAALKLLEDPDALVQYPEIKKIMEAQVSGDNDDWETTANVAEGQKGETVVEKVLHVEPTTKLAEAVAAPSAVAEYTGGDSSNTAVVEGEDVEEAEEDPREHLNLVFIGHVDAGKSTLSGSILYLMGMVDKRTIERFEREAKDRNRESWFLAFIMDTSEEERAKGKTVEVGRAHFETVTNRYTILDAPGHKNYVPNMISGAAQADVGVLVISARKGEFETGFEKGGQTREHALLAKTLGIEYLVVVVNKMDDPTVMWDKDRYEECVSKMKPYLKQCGYVIKTEVRFIPISGLAGDNVLNEVSSEKCKWWRDMYTSGAHNTSTPTLISTLDGLTISGRNPVGPLRIPCLDRYIERGCVVLGKVECGTLRVNEDIIIAPTKKVAKVEAIYIGEQKVRSAKPGENVLIKFSINAEDIQKGYMLCSQISVCPAVTVIKAQLALVDLLDHRPIFCPGYDAVMHVHTVEVEVTCTELVSVLDAKGKPMKRPFARQGQMCMVLLTLPMSTCMEPFLLMPSLGRLTLRDEGKTIAIGKIVQLVK
jgi:peptide chain release factor subunit 3